jgi:hypothetical protein
VRAQAAALAGLAGGQAGMVLVKGLQQGQAFFQPGDPVPALQRRRCRCAKGSMGDMAASRWERRVMDNPENDRLSNEK